jgi:formylglycine-generating enzyme required for sulfatase activity
MEPFETHYHTHQAFANYPVVNVSREGALAYCRWLQKKLNLEPGEAKYEVRLPSRIEWWYAANGGRQQAAYAWGGPNLRNGKGCTLANFRLVGDENVRRGPITGKPQVIEHPVIAMGTSGSVVEDADITAPVHAYSPNGFDLYNMNGNVAEMLAEPGQAAGGSWRSPGYDVRNQSLMAFNGPSPEVGFRVVVVVQ